MPNLSAPMADNEAVTGSPYNILRQDLLNNHAHSGANDGGEIAHGSLLDAGVYSHEVIDSKLNSLEGRTPWTWICGGRVTQAEAETNKTTHGHHVMLPEALRGSTTYVVQVTLRLVANAWDKQNAFWTVTNYDGNGFDVAIGWNGTDAESPQSYRWYEDDPGNRAGWATKADTFIHWTAYQP